MTPSPHNRSLVFILYANAALLVLILAVLVSRGASVLPAASAAIAPPQPIAGNGSLYLMPGQLLGNVWGCYVLNVDTQTLCTYAYNGNQLRLIASRNIRYDYQLSNYNTHPDPEEIHRLVDLQRQQIRGINPAVPQGPAATQQTTKPNEFLDKNLNDPAQ